MEQLLSRKATVTGSTGRARDRLLALIWHPPALAAATALLARGSGIAPATAIAIACAAVAIVLDHLRRCPVRPCVCCGDSSGRCCVRGRRVGNPGVHDPGRRRHLRRPGACETIGGSGEATTGANEAIAGAREAGAGASKATACPRVVAATAAGALVSLSFGFVLGASSGVASGTAGPERLDCGFATEEPVEWVRGRVADEPTRLRGDRIVFDIEVNQYRSRSGTVFHPEAGAGSRWLGAGPTATVFAETERVVVPGMQLELDGSPRTAADGGHVLSVDDGAIRVPGLTLRARARAWFRTVIGARYGGDDRGLSFALLAGDRGLLPPMTVERFRRAGAMHVLALSGMHVGVIAALAILLARRIVGRAVARPVAALVLVGYVLVVGVRASLLRSVVMFVVALAFRRLGRRVSLIDVLGLTLCLHLVLAPADAGQLGFALSYAAVAGIALAVPLLAPIASYRLPRVLALAVSASFGAQAGTALPAWRAFGELRPIGAIVSLGAGPAATLYLAVALIGLPLGDVPLLGSVVDRVLALLRGALYGMVSLGGQFPMATGRAAVIFVAAAPALAPAVLGMFLLVRSIHRRRTSTGHRRRLGRGDERDSP